MILVFVPKITNRVKYAFHLIFRDILGLEVRFTTSKEEFAASELPKISYAYHPVGDELFFAARNLLFETGINEQNIVISDYQQEPVFFMVGKQSALPFDPFAAAFYLVSRYEEYLPHIRDEHDRFDVRESLAYKNNFLQKPLVNHWAQLLRGLLQAQYPALSFANRKFRFVSTIDIDNAYAFREKGFMRSLGGFAKSILHLNWSEVWLRARVLLGFSHDPYDTYARQFELQKKYGIRVIYFVLLGDYGLNDKNLPATSHKFQSLIKTLGDYAEVGIHPSYGSNQRIEQLQKEINRLAKILNREVTKSRQHFLKLTLPDTYRNLIELDVLEDYSMGYAAQPGFRASICTPFRFYDLDLEIETKLKVYPFAVMESTYKYYLQKQPQEVVKAIRPILEQTKQVNGDFVTLWHNDSMSNYAQWQGWQRVYEQMLELVFEDNTHP